MYYNQTDPYGGTYDGGYYGGGTEPTDPPEEPTGTSGSRFGDPGPNGWWALVNGVWRWITEPVSRNVAPTT